jgi:ADP-heptose:LPS heptosyltransferase
MKIPDNILIMRPRGMREAAMLVPVVHALRCAYPDLRITIFTKAAFRPFFSEVEELEFLDYVPAGYGMAGLWRLVREMKRKGFDSVADLDDSGMTKVLRLLLSMSGAAVSVIERDREGMRRLTRRTRKHLEPLVPETELCREAIAALGFEFGLPAHSCGKHTRTLPQKIVTAAGIKHGTWVGVAPFARHKGKIYPIPLADKLIEILSSRYDRVIILGSGEHERSFAEGMEKRHNGVLSMVDKLDMSLEMDIISNLDVMVTMDTGLMHIASLVGVPAVSVWGATHPYAGFYGFGQEPANAVLLDMPCRPCSADGGRRCIFGHYHCLTGIPPETIAETVARVLGK